MSILDGNGEPVRSHDLKGPTKEQATRFGCGCLTIVGAVVLVMSLLTPFTTYLWYAHDARQVGVFSTSYATRGLLFSFAFVPTVAILYFSLSRALSVSLVYLRIPETIGELMLSNALSWFRHNAGKATKVASLLLAIILALGFAGEWNTYLLATHAESFGRKDPTFGLDIGFFVFTLPWLLAIANYALGMLLLTLALTLAIYIGMQLMASLAKVELSRPFVRMHISVLGGLTIIAFAAQLWLRRFEVGLADGTQFTGAGYAGMQQLGAQGILAVLVAVLGVATIVNGRVGEAFKVPIVGGIACAVLYVLGVQAYPALIQRFKVEPDKINLESPYAKQAIAMTRLGYALDRVQVRDAIVEDQPSGPALAEAQTTVDNMRLWDPQVLRETIDVIQTLKGYYIFNDVDVDRYTVGGKQTMMMVGARDIYPEGLDPKSRTWVTERLQYTHGFGVAMSPVNTADSEGLPTFVIKDIPPSTPPEIPLKQPRIYFSDYRDDRRESRDLYALVNTNVDEFDHPDQSDKMTTHQWAGDRGVPMGGFMTRLAFSVVFQDINVLISGNITPKTKLLLHRNVIERARLIYPFLQFDQDPYVVIHNGGLVWLLDGYTVSGQVPYSARMVGNGQPLNYIRNSVKVTIDAYSGETRAYAMEPDEPLLKAYRRIYPGLVSDRSALPKGLEEHLRYPEDLFFLQAFQLTQYHVSQPSRFLNNSDAWDMPFERGLSGNGEATRPYYVQMRLPDQAREGFMLILPFTPRQKINMSAWLAAHCDPEHYGELVLYQYGEGTNVPGPAQMEATFNQDKVIADINRQLNNDQSKLIPGNLLLVPLGKSFLYVEPLFLQSRSVGIPPKPELKKVILALPKGKPVVADTYEEALQELFGNRRIAPETVTAPPDRSAPQQPGAPSGVNKAEIADAAKLLDEAEKALRAGDFAKYGELQRKLKAKLEELSRR